MACTCIASDYEVVSTTISNPQDTGTATSDQSDWQALFSQYIGMPYNEKTVLKMRMDLASVYQLTTDDLNVTSLASTGTYLNNTIYADAGTANTIQIGTIANGVLNINDYRPLDSYGYVYGGDSPALDPFAALWRKLAPTVVVRSKPVVTKSPAEALAQEALREMVTESEFRKYLKFGFVLVKGRSGAVYQVYRNRSHVKVWVGGKVVEEVCVYLRPGVNAPDTDKVVAFKAMIEADEEAFKAMGNRYRMAA